MTSVRNLEVKLEENHRGTTATKEMRDLHNLFVTDSIKMFENRSQQAIQVLNQQQYSQEMMECLINDMLDQAKIDNDAFKLNEEYFDLPKVVYKSLNIVKEQANQKFVKLVAEVESPQSLQLISNIWGD